MQRRPHSSVGSGGSCHLGRRDGLAAIVDFDVPGHIRTGHRGSSGDRSLVPAKTSGTRLNLLDSAQSAQTRNRSTAIDLGTPLPRLPRLKLRLTEQFSCARRELPLPSGVMEGPTTATADLLAPAITALHPENALRCVAGGGSNRRMGEIIRHVLAVLPAF